MDYIKSGSIFSLHPRKTHESQKIKHQMTPIYKYNMNNSHVYLFENNKICIYLNLLFEIFVYEIFVFKFFQKYLHFK